MPDSPLALPGVGFLHHQAKASARYIRQATTQQTQTLPPHFQPPKIHGRPSGYLCCGPTNLSMVSAVLLIFCKTRGRLRADQGTANSQPSRIRPNTNIEIAIMIAPATNKATTGWPPNSLCLPSLMPGPPTCLRVSLGLGETRNGLAG
jgi:hypothetical protein